MTAFLSLLIASSIASAGTLLKCDYDYYGGPFASIELELGTDGSLPLPGTITQYGRAHSESVTPGQPAAGERFHYWLSKENPENTIEVIVYSAVKDGKNTKMINSKLPFGNEMTGICR